MDSAAHPSPSLAVARGFWAAGAAVAVLHAAVTLFGLLPSSEPWVTSPWTPVAAFAAGALACLARGVAEPRDRAAWCVLGAGLAAYAAGQAWSIALPAADRLDFVTVPNALWLSLYPCAMTAIFLMVRSRGVRGRPEQWLDGVTGALTLGATGTLLLFALIIDPLDALHAAPTTLAFTLGDLLVVGFGIGAIAVLGWRPPLPLSVLVVAFALLGLQDAVYLDHALRGIYPAVLDTSWIAAMVAIAMAATTRPSPEPLGVGAPRRMHVLAVVFAAVAVALALFEAASEGTSTISAVLTSLALVALLVRAALTVRAHETTIEALERTEAHLAEAQRLAGVGSWEWLPASDSVWSAEMARLHGLADHAQAPPDLPEFLALVDPADHERFTAVLAGALVEGGPFSVDYRASATGRVVQFDGCISHDEQGDFVRAFGTAQDVTDRFARAQAERANLAKNEFLSRMSHELRTPLNAVLGFGQLLQAGDLTERQRGKVGHILGAGRHLLALVDEVLDLARIEGGQMSLSLEPVEVGPLVRECLDLVSPAARVRGISLVVADAPEAWAHADQQRLKQVLLNLLSNAVKYNRDGGRVDVRVEAGGDAVRIAVADTGIGILDRDLPRLFEPFERLDSGQAEVEGTGLGLALSRALAEAMGGSVGVDSEAGLGSTFTLALASAQPARRPLVAAAEPTALAPDPDGGHVVLCIEDNVSNLALLTEVFSERPGVRLLTAVQGSLGLDLARQHRPDLVLLDLNLPDMPGEEVLQRLRAGAATEGTPVVVVSADATQRQIARLRDAGARDYVTKPLDIPHLMSVVDEALGAVPAGC